MLPRRDLRLDKDQHSSKISRISIGKRSKNGRKSTNSDVEARARHRVAAKFFIFDTKFLVFDTEFLVFDTRLLVFDSKFISFTHFSNTAPLLLLCTPSIPPKKCEFLTVKPALSHPFSDTISNSCGPASGSGSAFVHASSLFSIQPITFHIKLSLFRLYVLTCHRDFPSPAPPSFSVQTSSSLVQKASLFIQITHSFK